MEGPESLKRYSEYPLPSLVYGRWVTVADMPLEFASASREVEMASSMFPESGAKPSQRGTLPAMKVRISLSEAKGKLSNVQRRKRTDSLIWNSTAMPALTER